MTGRLRLGHNQVTNPEKASLLVFLAEFHRTAAKTMASPVHPEDVVGFESESVWWRPVLHLIGIYGFQMQRPGRGGLLVPQISKSAVSHPALKKQLLEVVALQSVPKPGRSAVALAEAEGLPDSSRGSSEATPPEPARKPTAPRLVRHSFSDGGRGARVAHPETITR